MSDKITVLTTFGEVLTKRHTIGDDGNPITLDYDDAFMIRADEHTISDIRSLSLLLKTLENYPSSCVIRGAPKPGADLTRCRRLLHDRPGAAAAFERAPRRWLALDIDSLEIPPSLDPLANPDEAVEYVVERLPIDTNRKKSSCNSPFPRGN